MKRSVILAGFLVSLFLTPLAYAVGPYMSGNLGVAIPLDSDIDGTDAKITSDTGFGMLGAVGYDFGMFRLEGELGYQESDLDKIKGYGESFSLGGDVSVLSGLVNGYVDFHNDTKFTPYLTAGLGMANVDVSSNQYWSSDDDTVFAYQFGAGCTYDITTALALDIRYRYFATDDPEFDLMEVELASNNVYAGLRYSF